MSAEFNPNGQKDALAQAMARVMSEAAKPKLDIPDGKKMDQILFAKIAAKEKDQANIVAEGLAAVLKEANNWNLFDGRPKLRNISIGVSELAKKCEVCQYSMEKVLTHPHLLDTMFAANWQVVYQTGFYPDYKKNRPEHNRVLLIPVGDKNWPDFQAQVAIWKSYIGVGYTNPEWILFGAEFIRDDAWKQARATTWDEWQIQLRDGLPGEFE